MKVIFEARSTNGRWGMAIVGPEGTKLPAQGSLASLGTVAGIETYLFTPSETGTWILAGGDLQPRGGATTVRTMNLQSSSSATILLLGPEAVIEQYGYKRRSSRYVAYVNGEARDIPASILLAMGIIASESTPTTSIPPPPALSNTMANAFSKLRGQK